MPFAAPLRVVPPAVDFDASHSVVLLCTPRQRRSASAFAESLLASGFDALVSDDSLDAMATIVDDRPVLLVPMDPDLDNPVYRSRVRRALGRDPTWIGGEVPPEAFMLQRRIQARLDALEMERTDDAPSAWVQEPASNVVRLPTSTRAPEPEPEPATRRTSRLHVVVWPVVGAAVTALGMAVALRGRAAPEQVEIASAPTRQASPEPRQQPTEPKPATTKRTQASVPPPPPPPAPPTATAAPEPLEASGADTRALEHERVTATEDYLVYLAPERPRDWFEAMNLCRGRTHAGIGDWTTPSSRQLHALAGARILPEAPLWSRTRSAHSKDVAFVVHGKVGNARSTEKTEALSAAVCIRKRDEAPDGV